jgi:hypothetical protein
MPSVQDSSGTTASPAATSSDPVNASGVVPTTCDDIGHGSITGGTYTVGNDAGSYTITVPAGWQVESDGDGGTYLSDPASGAMVVLIISSTTQSWDSFITMMAGIYSWVGSLQGSLNDAFAADPATAPINLNFPTGSNQGTATLAGAPAVVFATSFFGVTGLNYLLQNGDDVIEVLVTYGSDFTLTDGSSGDVTVNGGDVGAGIAVSTNEGSKAAADKAAASLTLSTAPIMHTCVRYQPPVAAKYQALCSAMTAMTSAVTVGDALTARQALATVLAGLDTSTIPDDAAGGVTTLATQNDAYVADLTAQNLDPAMPLADLFTGSLGDALTQLAQVMTSDPAYLAFLTWQTYTCTYGINADKPGMTSITNPTPADQATLVDQMGQYAINNCAAIQPGMTAESCRAQIEAMQAACTADPNAPECGGDPATTDDEDAQ